VRADLCIFWGVAYYVAFGPHGPRAPTSQPGDNLKIFLATMGLVGSAFVASAIIHQWGGLLFVVCPTRHTCLTIVFVTLFLSAAPPPKTMTKEWEEATNERAREMKLNPITGTCSQSLSTVYAPNNLVTRLAQVSPRKAIQAKVSSNQTNRFLCLIYRAGDVWRVACGHGGSVCQINTRIMLISRSFCPSQYASRLLLPSFLVRRFLSVTTFPLLSLLVSPHYHYIRLHHSMLALLRNHRFDCPLPLLRMHVVYTRQNELLALGFAFHVCSPVFFSFLFFLFVVRSFLRVRRGKLYWR
jgi:Cytochrome c oxidase subunit IV